MRIGTWNLQGRWDQRHLDHIAAMACDVLLLTEVSERVQLPGLHLHQTPMTMAPRRRWAAVASHRPLRALAEPHGASCMVELEDLRICSSILPWRNCGSRDPWQGSTTAERTKAAIEDIQAATPTVWGGDWNHALAGREWTGTKRGRAALLVALEQLGLQVPTTDLPHQIPGLLSIDHIAIPTSWNVLAVERHRAFAMDIRISDHDAYVVEADLPPMLAGLF